MQRRVAVTSTWRGVCPVFRLQGSGATFLRRDAGARTVLVFLICLLRTSRPSLTMSAGVLAHNALGPVRAAAAFFDAAASRMLRPHARIGELRYCSALKADDLHAPDSSSRS